MPSACRLADLGGDHTVATNWNQTAVRCILRVEQVPAKNAA